VVEEKARCREIGEHPCLRNPGPERYDVEPIKPICMVPKDAKDKGEARFKNSPFEGERKVDNPSEPPKPDPTKWLNPTKLLKFSTECHPLSSTYPYPEPQKPASAAEDAAQEAEAQKTPRHMQSTCAHPEPDRRKAIRTVDLNAQYFKFNSKPQFGFGSSGIGFRFSAGTEFRNKPSRRDLPHSRLRGFRELRESIPERSEQEYKDALEKALAEAAKAAAAQAAAAEAEKAGADPASPPKRKSAAPSNQGERSSSKTSEDGVSTVPTAAAAEPAPPAADPLPEAVSQAA